MIKHFESILHLVEFLHETDIPTLNIVVDKDDFELVDMGGDTFRFIPGPSSPYLYRGQVRNWPTCRPSLFRCNALNPIDLFVEYIRVADFELLLQQHPAVKAMQGERISVDFVALAQHYGLSTNCLDLTSSIDIAAFFASCSRLADGGYLPYADSDKGVIFRSPWVLLDPELAGKIQIVGFQPLKRPAEQKAWGYILDKNEDFAQQSEVFHFSQSKKGSEYFYEMFEAGAKLFPPDPICSYVDRIRESKQYSFEAFHRAFRQAFDRNILGNIREKEIRDELLKQKSLSIDHDPVFCLDNEDVKAFNQEWIQYYRSMESKLGFRRACYPER